MKITQNKLFLKQNVDVLEIFTSFETNNRYIIASEEGKELYYAFEKSTFLSKMFARSHRKMDIEILDANKKEVMYINRPFFWFKPTYNVKVGGKVVGKIVQPFAFFPRFDVFDSEGNLVFNIKYKIFHPWSFTAKKNGQDVAKILKKWSGFKKEMFTDADTFLIEFDNLNKNDEKLLFLAAAFAVDYRFFEQDKSRRDDD